MLSGLRRRRRLCRPLPLPSQSCRCSRSCAGDRRRRRHWRTCSKTSRSRSCCNRIGSSTLTTSSCPRRSRKSLHSPEAVFVSTKPPPVSGQSRTILAFHWTMMKIGLLLLLLTFSSAIKQRTKKLSGQGQQLLSQSGKWGTLSRLSVMMTLTERCVQCGFVRQTSTSLTTLVHPGYTVSESS